MNMPIPATMTAALVEEHGGPEKLLLVQRPVPQPAAGEVLVEIKAMALNHLDLWVRRGVSGHRFPLPIIPGCDGAGIVVSVGDGVDEKVVGDEVVLAPGVSCGRCQGCLRGDDHLCGNYGILGETRDGTCASFVTVPASNLIRKPTGISWEEAAAFPLVALTSWTMLTRKARLKAGETLLVIAAGSGVGSMAVQMGNILGARVLATAGSEKKRSKAKELGAEVTIDHSNEDWGREVKKLTASKGADVVFENVGSATWKNSMRSVARGGRIVTCGATTGGEVSLDLKALFFKNIAIFGSTMGRRGDLHSLTRLQERGLLKAIVADTFPLEKIHEAHARLESRDVFGKVVVVL